MGSAVQRREMNESNTGFDRHTVWQFLKPQLRPWVYAAFTG